MQSVLNHYNTHAGFTLHVFKMKISNQIILCSLMTTARAFTLERELFAQLIWNLKTTGHPVSHPLTVRSSSTQLLSVGLIHLSLEILLYIEQSAGAVSNYLV